MNNTSGHDCHRDVQTPPTIYHQAVRRDLCDPECPVKQTTMIQYVDDILIASTDHEVHQTELASLLDYLHKKGHKCSFHKAQIAKKQVTFLGQTIGAGNRSITQDRAASVKAILRLLPLKHSAHFRNNRLL